MKTIRTLVSMASADWSFVPGDLIHVPDEVADARIAAGLAELYVEIPETPVLHPDYAEAAAGNVSGGS